MCSSDLASPAFAEFVDQFKGSDGAIRNVRNIKSGEFNVGGFRPYNTVITGDSATSGGAFITPARYGPVTDLIGERELTVRDLCTNIDIQSDTFEFVRVTGKTNNAAAVPEATTVEAIYQNTADEVTYEDAQFIYDAAFIYLC